MTGLLLQPAAGPLNAVVNVPGSKSLTNRALICAALADGDTHLTRALLADDTRHMIDALRALGIRVDVDENTSSLTVSGCRGHLPAGQATLYCGNSGTTMRFCTALVCLGMGDYRLEGVARMYQRPIGALVDALRRLGGRFEYPGADGYPPLTAHADGLNGGETFFDAPPSSQVISALLMAAPYARSDVFIDVAGPLVSAPYVDMTLRVMQDFGVEVVANTIDTGARYIVAAPQRYRGRTYTVEPDASNASYFLAAPAVVGGTVTVSDLGTDSAQGDIRFADLLEQMGCRVEWGKTSLTVHGPDRKLTGIDVDLNAMPDMAQTLAVLALFADGPTRIRNVANLRIKETDRLTALATELGRLGARVDLHDDGLTVHPPANIQPATIETYDDHRMAMSFALAGLAVDGIVIGDPGCVAKTFPDFFDRWHALATGRPTIE
ncbi:MAG: 3-phosphoshikimate 1-carboxyvinyltransferase [Phycisphaerae bacterium]